uniref:Uncharacterized protein n=1 Tax=Oryza meridionalis TaxID=40149 RepID=A0A0E0FE51_9ORYZ
MVSGLCRNTSPLHRHWIPSRPVSTKSPSSRHHSLALPLDPSPPCLHRAAIRLERKFADVKRKTPHPRSRRPSIPPDSKVNSSGQFSFRYLQYHIDVNIIPRYWI